MDFMGTVRSKRAVSGVALLVATIVFGMMSVAIPQASASTSAAYEKCNSVREVYSSDQDGYFRVPARGTTISCWLAYDRSASNSAVTSLQGHIKTCYIEAGRISWSGDFAVDGYYGDDTVAALKKVQNYHGVGADGEYGPTTRDAMFLRWYANPGGGGRSGCSNQHSDW
jgi:peptidoglycan hydrolase-like protein with peptidoglycan-binding domain